MIDACQGKDSFEVYMETLIGIVLVLPPFPYSDDTKIVKDIPIYGLTDKNKKNVQPQSIKMGKYVDDIKDGVVVEKKDWVTTGPYVCIVCSRGNTVEKAREKVYKIIDELSVSDIGYRDDIGEKVIKALPELQKLGFAMDWEIESD